MGKRNTKVKKVICAILAASVILGAPQKNGIISEASVQPGQLNEGESLNSSQERSLNFNSDWRFQAWLNAGENKRTYSENDAQVASVQYDDSSWRNLDLPHDWSIEQDFTSEVSVEYGALPTGTGWYRKKFTLPESYMGKNISIEFGGVYSNSDVYVNGTKIGTYPYGYNSFSYDITDELICDGKTENLIAVKAVSPKGGSRWYTGSGIYRNVSLTITDPVHVAYHGTAVYMPDIKTEYENGAVNVKVKTTVENDGTEDANVSVRNTICEYESGEAFTGASPGMTEVISLGSGEKKDIEGTLTAQHPQLWSVEDPNLYIMKTEILKDGQVADIYETRFGFTWSSFDAQDGFSLNGKWMKLRGVCMHHDQGALGAAAYEASIYRQMRIMKEMGANAIRVTHNPADDALLKACDELGLLVVEEAYDGWWKKKANEDHARNFNNLCTHPDAQEGRTWGEFDFQQMIRKSRNSPSVIMWSIGNEVYDSGSEATEWVKKTVETLSKEVDPAGRPLTMGDNKFKRISSYDASGDRAVMANTVDVVGLNYSEEKYDKFHTEWEPEWILYGSETASAVTSRGWYSDPSKTTGAQYINEYQLSSYDNSSVSWGRTATDSYIPDRDRKWVAGQFIWTGFDYIGEPSPFGSKGGSAVGGPKSSYFGVVDTAGFAKDSYYLYQSQWLDVKNNPMVHIFPHWNWEDENLRNLVTVDGKIPVRVYSNAPEVELFVDGKSQGKKAFAQKTTDYGYPYQQQSESSDRLYLEWPLVWEYAQGRKLEAVAYDKDGNEIARDQVVTAGKAAGLSAEADRYVIEADGYDLSFITVDVEDADGNFVPTADNEIYFKISGNGKIVGVDNGDAASWERYKDYNGVWKRKAFSGKVLVIVQSEKEAGKFTLTASGAGLLQDSVTVYTVDSTTEGEEILGYEAGSAIVCAGALPENLKLPETVDAVKKDGSKEDVAVTWTLPTAEQLSKPCEIEVKGIVKETIEVSLHLTVKGPVGIQELSVVVGVAQKPVLPEQVDVIWTDGSTELKNVKWEDFSGQDINTVGNKFKVNGTVEDYPDMTAVANIRIGEGTEEVNVALPENGGNISNASVSQNIAGRVIDNAWDKAEAWNTGGAEDTKRGWLSLKFDQSYPIEKVSLCTWKKTYTVPGDVKVQYKNAQGQWADVTNMAIDQPMALYAFSTITFDSVMTDEMKFIFSTEKLASETDSIGISELQVFGKRTKVVKSEAAELEELNINGVPVEGFDPKVRGYLHTLEYDAKIPEVTAKAADGATCFVIPPLTADGTAMILVTAEDGEHKDSYSIQFSRKAPVLTEVMIENDFSQVKEDDVIDLPVIGIRQDQSEVSASKASVVYTVTDGTGHAEIRGGKFYAYTKGTVTVIAKMTYEGNTCESDPVEITIRESDEEKEIVSFEEIQIKTAVGVKPVLPDWITANYNTGLPKKVPVTWENVSDASVATIGVFSVNGTVEGSSIQPSVRIEVVGILALENLSMAVADGYPTLLPEKITVYYSDGTTSSAAVVWEKTEETDAVTKYSGTVEGTNQKAELSVRTAQETEQSENFVKKYNGWGLPDGLASYTNDMDVNANALDKATYLNDGYTEFNNGSSKQIWCNYVPSSVDPNKTQHTSDWIAVPMAVSGQIVKQMADKVRFGVIDEEKSSTKTMKVPKAYYVEYYTGPEYSDMLMTHYTTDGIAHGGQMENETYWPVNPLKNPENWKEVTYISKADLPKGENGDWKKMLETAFEPVETSLIRIRFEAYEDYCIGVNEMEVYGTLAVEEKEVKEPKILIDGQDRTSEFRNKKLELQIEEGQPYPVITASAGNNAAITILPASAANPVTTVRFVPENGNEVNTEIYTIAMQKSQKPAGEVTVTYRAGTGGIIRGTAVQTISKGGSTEAVTAAANQGYHFVKWSDGKTESTRSDTNVQGSVTYTAEFAKDIVAAADKSTLHAKIAEAEKKDASLYTETSYKVLTEALKIAKEVSGNAEVSQKQVDEIATALGNAIKGLKEKEVEPTPEVKKPGIPSYVKASWIGKKNIKVTWKEAADAEQYLVYRSYKKSSGFKKLAAVKTLSYTDKKAKAGKTAYYKVIAYKGSVNGSFSKTASAYKLKTPYKVKAVARKHTVTVSVGKVAKASGYEIYRASKKNGTYKKVATRKAGKAKTVKKTFDKMKKGTFYYKVRAYKISKNKKIYTDFGKAVKAKVK